MSQRPLNSLSMPHVLAHYQLRERLSTELQLLFKKGARADFAGVALGITNRAGNYSASDHAAGEKIVAARSSDDVFNLAIKIERCVNPAEMLDTIYAAQIPHLKVSVGSEIAMMLQPKLFWVANVRTVWAHLLVRHEFNYAIADEALRLYASGDSNSQMHYSRWKGICLEMADSVRTLAELGTQEAKAQKCGTGSLSNLWFDAIADSLYARHHDASQRPAFSAPYHP